MSFQAKLTIVMLLFLFQSGFTFEKAIHTVPDNVQVDALNSLAAKIYTQNPEKALKLLTDSEILANKLHYDKGLMQCYFLLGKINNTRQDYKKALNYASMGLAIANKLNLHSSKKDFFLLISEITYDKSEKVKDTSIIEQVRDIKAAIKYKYSLKDSLDKIQHKANSLSDEVVVKKNELTVSRFEKYLWIIGCIVLILILNFVLLNIKTKKIKMENDQLITEQKLLRSQMNPHFIFNSIQNIRALIRDKKDIEAIDYLNKFSQLTRQILESSNENYTSLADELNLIENYISLQQLLYNKTFGYSLVVEEAIDPEFIFIPPMLTQPFIENAIKHGLSNKQEDGLLSINFYKKNEKLIFEVCDNGYGFDATKKSEHKSLAISITKDRLINYTKNKHFSLDTNTIFDVDKKPVGAKVTFEIPYIYET